MIEVLTIDADYWFPLEQDYHCGRCRESRNDPPFERLDSAPWQHGENRVHPTISEIVKRVRPLTPIKVSESHAEMHKLLRRISSVTYQPVRVVNIDEHSDCTPFDVHFGDRITCGNWVSAAIYNNILRYYRLIDSERKFRRWKGWHTFVPDVVHVCRSGPYMSTLGDQHFVDLVLALERKSGFRAHFMGHDHKQLKAMVDVGRGWKRHDHQLRVLECDTLQVIHDPGENKVTQVMTLRWSP